MKKAAIFDAGPRATSRKNSWHLLQLVKYVYSNTPRSRFLRLLACLLCSPLPHGQVELTVHTVGQGLRSLWKKIKSLTPRRVLSLRRPSTTTNFQKETLFENEILYANLMRYEHFFVCSKSSSAALLIDVCTWWIVWVARHMEAHDKAPAPSLLLVHRLAVVWRHRQCWQKLREFS